MTFVFRPRSDSRGAVLPLLAFFFFLLSQSTLAQEGSLDVSFGAASGAQGTIKAVALQPDGKVIVGGEFTNLQSVERGGIARLNTDGTVDNSFSSLGVTGVTPSVNAIVIQPDGKVLLGGVFSLFDGTARQNLARLDANGNLDSTFLATAGANGRINRIVLQPDGKILIGGSFSSVNGVNRSGLARLNADGTLDAGFNPIILNPRIEALAVLADGKILIGGDYSSVNGVQRFGDTPTRLNANGTIDLSFGPVFAGGTSVKISGFLPLADGKFLVYGRFRAVNDIDRQLAVRFNADGSFDPTFTSGISNPVSFSLAETMMLLPDGKILVGGEFNTADNSISGNIARLNPNGDIDSSFNVVPGLVRRGTNGPVLTVAMRPDGKIVSGGSFTAFNDGVANRLVQLTASGTFDPGFLGGSGSIFTTGGLTGVFISIAQPDGKILAGGGFRVFNGVTSPGLIRLNTDGSVDTSFSVGEGFSGIFEPRVFSLAVQSDGKILVGGFYSTVHGVNQSFLARLNSDGSRDPSFTAASEINGSCRALLVRPDGKILAGGDFRTPNSVQTGPFLLNSDGTIDNTFPGSGLGLQVFKFLRQPDGKILINGLFGLRRLNSDGTPDDAFNTTSAVSTDVLDMGLLPNGQIYICGRFQTAGGQNRAGLARLNADGTVDPGFISGFLADSFCDALGIQPNGKLLVVGRVKINAQQSFAIGRLNPDGMIDSSFSIGTGLGPSERAGGLVLQPNGRAVVYGLFTTYNGLPRNNMARFFYSLDCTFETSPVSTTIGAAGGTGTILVSTASGCPWSAVSNVPWLTIVRGANGNGTQSVTYFAEANARPERVGTVTVAGRTFTLTQENGCNYTVSPRNVFVPAFGGNRFIQITSVSDCPWTVVSNSSWITVTFGSSGTGSNVARLDFARNDGPRRTGTVTAAGMTITVTQGKGISKTVGAFRPQNGFVYLRNSNTAGFADTEFFYGLSNDIPVTGDWDGNGTDTIGVYRNGTFFLKNSNSSGFADIQFPFGTSGDIPITGDWDGDGIDTIGVVRGTQIFLRNSNSGGNADIQFNYGTAGDIYITGDWNGDGIDTIGAFRQSNGFVYLRDSNSTGFANNEFFYGIAGDRPISGDWDGNGFDSIGVVRGSEWFLRNSNSSGFADIQFFYGLQGDVPIVGDWDGLP